MLPFQNPSLHRCQFQVPTTCGWRPCVLSDCGQWTVSVSIKVHCPWAIVTLTFMSSNLVWTPLHCWHPGKSVYFVLALEFELFKKYFTLLFKVGFPCGSAGKEFACNAGDQGSIPESGKSSGEDNGYPLQYSGLDNSMGCIVHGVTKSRTWRSSFHFLWIPYNTKISLKIKLFLFKKTIWF